MELILLSTPIVIVAVAIEYDSPEPIFFRQRRLVKDGRPFTILKFRTMYHQAPVTYNSDGSTYNSDEDPRMTHVGKFLRSYSIDELPQLINMLKRPMSLVEPRPNHIEMLEFYKAEDRKCLTVKPRITCLAAIEMRQSISWQERLDYDVWYVNHCSS